MSLFASKPLYEWDEPTRARALAVFDEIATWPGVTVATHLRRPQAMKGRVLIAAADQDGMAFRVAGLQGRRARGLAVRGMTLLGASQWQQWRDAARRAYDEAG